MVTKRQTDMQDSILTVIKEEMIRTLDIYDSDDFTCNNEDIINSLIHVLEYYIEAQNHILKSQLENLKK